MMNQNDIVLQIISRLTEIDGAPCKKKLQKMVYLIEEKDIDLGFQYKIHFYGPYSEDLDYTICELKARHELDITYGNKGHILECVKEVQCPSLTEQIEKVIDTFGKMTAQQLELITTALFAERHITVTDDVSIMNAVKKIKGSKFSDGKIKDAISLLKETKYIFV